MALESFWSPYYCTVGLQRKETEGNTRLKILEWESIGARSHKGPLSPVLYKKNIWNGHYTDIQAGNRGGVGECKVPAIKEQAS